MDCTNCKHCSFPISENDNNGSCKCKIMKNKSIDVYVCDGATPTWCPLNKSNPKDILKYLAQRNGVEQDVFVLEEMSELQKELMKHRRGKENRNEIVDECVDVLLTIQILLEVYNATENEIKSLMDFKLNRLRDFLPRKQTN